LEFDFSYSEITEMELLGKIKIWKLEISYINEVLQSCMQLNFDYRIKTKAIEMKQKYKIKLPDAIIASTAIINNLPLLTADKGFSIIKELNLILIDEMVN
jgi:predicted nucleic acid-binding protein